LLARDGIRMCMRQLDHGEDGVKVAEVGGGRVRWYAPWPTQALMTKGPKHR
jgi:hypothetical protein